MRVMVLAAVLAAGCTAPSPATPSEVAVAGTPTPAASPTSATPSRTTTAPPTSPTPVVSTTFTSDDEHLAKLIRVGVVEAIPRLKRLNVMGPSEQVALFEPLGAWISTQKAGLAAYTPSSCTATAVTLFLDGIEAYDDIRQRFLAWKDWGAHGRAYSLGAPREIATTLEKATVELETECPGQAIRQ